MVVASGSCPRDFFNKHNNHLFASTVLVDLLVQSPSVIGAASKGVLCKDSRGLAASLATLANSMAQGVLPTQVRQAILFQNCEN